MSSDKSVEQWTKDHFICLVLLHASYADLEYSTEEKNHILSYVSSCVLAEVEQVFNELGDFDQLNLIMTLKSNFLNTHNDKTQLLSLLKNHFNSDGDYSSLEDGLYKFLEKLL